MNIHFEQFENTPIFLTPNVGEIMNIGTHKNVIYTHSCLEHGKEFLVFKGNDNPSLVLQISREEWENPTFYKQSTGKIIRE